MRVCMRVCMSVQVYVPPHMCAGSTEAEVVWERLTEKERREFERLLSEGKLADMLDTYTPWWQVSVTHVMYHMHL